MARDAVEEARQALGRLNGVHSVQPVHGRPDEVAVHCDENVFRAVKSRLMREGFSYQSRERPTRQEPGGDFRIFKMSGGSRRRGPPRNSRELTRDIQRGDFDFKGGRR